MILSDLNKKWLDDFILTYERRPRVLHIGNIANNAYNSARLMNGAGLDCDVICHDYYHIMGCPEWEDADFSEPVDDDFRPDWTKLNLHGYERPRWFVQGPVDLCRRYLMAKRGDDGKADQLWADVLVASKCVRPESRRRTAFELIESLSGFGARLTRVARKLLFTDGSIVSNIIFDQTVHRLAKMRMAILPALFLVFGIVLILRILVAPIYWGGQLAAGIGRWRRRGAGRGGEETPLEMAERLRGEWREQYRDRLDVLIGEDLIPYQSRLGEWKKLLLQYDYVIGYSTDPIYPLLCRVPYFAFEHGTIREIPYQKSSQGRLTALAYRKAEHVFVTNFDCVASAEYLAPGRFSVINHPYDEDHGLTVTGVDERREGLRQELQSDFIFFHPTRQDWVAGTGYADKANDQFLRAFGELRRMGYRVGLVCCSWGKNTAQTRQLIEDYGCTPYVKWFSPLAIIEFERMCLASDVVVDQFKLGAFGGVLFKAMAVGAPILTYLDVERLKAQYPEAPPVINCQSTSEIIDRMVELIGNREMLQSLGEEGRGWIKRHHSKVSTINTQVDQFRLSEPIPIQLGMRATVDG